MQVTTFALTDPGDRDQNDDAFAAADLSAGHCFAIADGAGGHHGGEIASRLSTDTALLHLAALPRWDEAALAAAVDAASAAVHARQRQDGSLSEMSSTLVLLCLDPGGDVARWTHLGDSRLYHFRRGVVEHQSRDHSVVQSFIDAGMTFPARRSGPDRSVLYAAIGAEGETRPTVMRSDLEDGDAFLLCTDGVWDALPTPELERLLVFAGSVREWIESVAAAVRRAQRPHQDNYSALGVWVGSPEEITVIRA